MGVGRGGVGGGAWAGVRGRGWRDTDEDTLGSGDLWVWVVGGWEGMLKMILWGMGVGRSCVWGRQ